MPEIPTLYVNKEDCCGCKACLNVCPNNAIEFFEDENGFTYPKINDSLCVGCKKCVRACRFTQEKSTFRLPLKCCAASLKDNEKLKKSSSGGVFGAFAEYFIKNGGVVYGASYNSDLEVSHIRIDTLDGIEKLRGSKYVQSDVKTVYRPVKKDLENGIKVFFTGTPCQIDALYSVLEKDYENLFTADLICHGVPNQKEFRNYISYLENKYKGKVVTYNFRSKANGWGAITGEFEVIRDESKNNVTIGRNDEFYFPAFISGNLSRENCFKCKYAKRERVGDITLGDFWGYKNADIKIPFENGLSVCLFNTEKALGLESAVSETLHLQETDYEIAVKGNECLRKPSSKGARYEKTVRLVSSGKCKKVAFSYNVRKYTNKIKRRIKKVINR